MSPEKTKYDKSWEGLFNELNILDEIKKGNTYSTTSKELNKFRESRLMSKFDTKKNIPRIFIENGLSILPINRETYVIGEFDTHLDITIDPTVKSKK
ncbi:type II restriction enzyme [Mammaliicoccus lentus]|uniref:type II restriction enzyme n=1 Tax=Mammaliicoccus lentus TaxID=42858 RepID=UPI001C4ECE2B|nr:hypothetical protein [Mammaliicoccus lentus]MBW0763744.1 hypothetical protein [Mammaliicoccus lentus]